MKITDNQTILHRLFSFRSGEIRTHNLFCRDKNKIRRWKFTVLWLKLLTFLYFLQESSILHLFFNLGLWVSDLPLNLIFVCNFTFVYTCQFWYYFTCTYIGCLLLVRSWDLSVEGQGRKKERESLSVISPQWPIITEQKEIYIGICHVESKYWN